MVAGRQGACAPSVRTWADQRFKAPDFDYDFWGLGLLDRQE